MNTGMKLDDNQKIVDIFNDILDNQAIQPQTLEKIEEWYENLEKDTIYVSSVTPLTNEQKEKIKYNLQMHTKKEFTLENLVDETILGGLRIKIGSLVIDMTLRSQLDRLKATLGS